MTWTARALSCAVVIAGVFVSSGCARRYAKNDCFGDQCGLEASSTGSACTANTDCSAEQYCNNGTCANIPQQPAADTSSQKPTTQTCAQLNDCPAGLFCHLARQECVQCLNDDACPANEVCLSTGACGAPQTGCSSTSCGTLVCDNDSGRCVQCLQNTDCPTGQTCRDKACFGNSACSSDADCAILGRVCDASTQKCVPCSTDAQCGSGKRCSAGTCTAAGGGSGNTGGLPDISNPLGGSCTSSQDCQGQACFIGTCMPCFMDEMCMDLTSLLSGASSICNPETGQCTQPQCASANDCAQGQACYGAGHCGACSSDDECRSGETCNTTSGVCARASSSTPSTPTTPPNNPPPANVSLGTIGAACGFNTDCSADLFCLPTGTTGGVCSRMCIGSGAGAATDCPLGYGCINMTSGAWDGLSVCLSANNVASDYPGRPFTQAPGASCAAGNACQTAICYADSAECARTCRANRDCAAGEVCWDAWSDTGMLGVQICSGSDTFSFLARGATCSSGESCDSGVCAGTCSGTQKACNSNSDCSSGTCSGTCTNHCRTQSDCPSNQRCAPWGTVLANNAFEDVTMVCLNKTGTGTTADGGACSTNTQCNSGWCVNGTCTQTCALDSDCQGALSARRCTPTPINTGSASITYAVGVCL